MIFAAKLLLPVSDITSTNSHHQTPLHVAGYQGSRGVWKAIVSFSLSKGSLANLLSAVDIFRRSPIDAAIYSGNSSLLGDIPKEYLPSNSEAIPAPESSKSTQTAILSHPYCRLHYTCPPSAIEESNAPPENVKRLAVLLDDDNGVLRGTDIESNVTFVEKCRPAAISDVLRVHEWSYVRKLQATCEGIPISRSDLISFRARIKIRQISEG